MDGALDGDTATYAMASLVRAHREGLATLADRAQVYALDTLDELLLGRWC